MMDRAPAFASVQSTRARDRGVAFGAGVAANSILVLILACVRFEAPASRILRRESATRLVPPTPRRRPIAIHRRFIQPPPTAIAAQPVLEVRIPAPAVLAPPVPAPVLPAGGAQPDTIAGSSRSGRVPPPDSHRPRLIVPATRFPAAADAQPQGRSAGRDTVDAGLFGAPRPIAGAAATRPPARAEPSDFGSASPASGRQNGRRAVGSTSAFDAVPVSAPASKALDRAPPFHSVEILSKPRPEYSEEARRMGIEGDVLLEVLFRADGTLRVERVLQSLGYGLDERAIRAAEGIRFQPAARAGAAVDQLATVRIRFQLAN
jgi:TonB family protein